MLRRAWWMAGLLALAAILLLPAAVLAHEDRTVGDVAIRVGWSAEPVFAGQLNAIEVRLTDRTTNRGIDGAQRGLQAELLYGGARKTLELQPLPGVPGGYRAEVLPTRPGQYRVRLVGQAGAATIDETFESGPRTFDDVVAATAVQFPDAVPAGAAVTEALARAQTLATIGIVAGVAGLVVAAGAGFYAWRSRAR
jgi:hypothetical protein